MALLVTNAAIFGFNALYDMGPVWRAEQPTAVDATDPSAAQVRAVNTAEGAWMSLPWRVDPFDAPSDLADGLRYALALHSRIVLERGGITSSALPAAVAQVLVPHLQSKAVGTAAVPMSTVRTRDDAGAGDTGDGGDPLQIPAPTDFTATPSIVGGEGQIALTWTAPVAPDGVTYSHNEVRFLKSGTNYAPWVRWADNNTPGVASHTLTGLSTGTVYDVFIRAVSDTGIAGIPASATVTIPVGRPKRPAGFTALPGNGEARLYWDEDETSDVDEYRYDWNSAASTTLTPTTISDSGAGEDNRNSFVFTSTNDTSIQVMLWAKNAAGLSLPATATVTPRSIFPNDVPADIADFATTTAWDATELYATLTISWTAAVAASEVLYYEYKLTSSDISATRTQDDWTLITGSDETTATHSITGLTGGTAYAYSLRSVNILGESTVETSEFTSAMGPAMNWLAVSAMSFSGPQLNPTPHTFAQSDFTHATRATSGTGNASSVTGASGDTLTLAWLNWRWVALAVPAADTALNWIWSYDGTTRPSGAGLPAADASPYPNSAHNDIDSYDLLSDTLKIYGREYRVYRSANLRPQPDQSGDADETFEFGTD